MIVIACVDDKMGMMFNNRRQSRDRVLINRIEALTVSSVLWMSSYSQQLFPQTNAEISDTFMEKAANGEYCFVENACLTSYENGTGDTRLTNFLILICQKDGNLYPSMNLPAAPMKKSPWRYMKSEKMRKGSAAFITSAEYYSLRLHP